MITWDVVVTCAPSAEDGGEDGAGDGVDEAMVLSGAAPVPPPRPDSSSAHPEASREITNRPNNARIPPPPMLHAAPRAPAVPFGTL